MKTFHSERRQEWADEDYRYAYAEDFLNTSIATQIVTLREQRGLSQAAFAQVLGTKQPGVSRLENVNHSTWKTETLKRIARALGVRLKISFETFGSLVDEEKKFSRSQLERPKFEEDPALNPQAAPMVAKNKYGALVQRVGSEWLAGFEAGRAYAERFMRIAYLNAHNLVAQATVTAPSPSNAGVFETLVSRKPPETAEYQGIPIPAKQPANSWIN
jgi:transcriptional regulator with XRE-family HTH domain